MTETETRLEQGGVAVCDVCNRARPIEKPVVEIFDARVGFGPAGETDMFEERNGEVTCYWCLEDE